MPAMHPACGEPAAREQHVDIAAVRSDECQDTNAFCSSSAEKRWPASSRSAWIRRVIRAMAEEVAEVARAGVQIGLVVGGGNFFRGVAAAARSDGPRDGDHMGMLATVINALALQDALESRAFRRAS